MKMKKTINIKCLALMLGLFAMTASCTNDDLANGETKDNKQTDGTVFVGGKSSASDSTKTRTGLEFLYSNAANSCYYWTTGDKIYLADGTASEPWDDTSGHSFDIAKVADFRFPGKVFTDPSYDIYVPGRNATAYNKVIIPTDKNGVDFKYSYSQHIYYYLLDGDGGYAKAIRQPDGKYYFTLEHQCAYLYMIPYVSNKYLGKSFRLKRINIKADSNIAGEFTITPTGLNGTGNSQEVNGNFTFDLTGTYYGSLGLSDGSQKNRDLAAALFHIAPVKSKLYVEYIFDLKTYKCSYGTKLPSQKEFKFKKEIPLFQYEKNTITPINSRLSLPTYETKLYQWDAEKDKVTPNKEILDNNDGWTSQFQLSNDATNTSLFQYNTSSGFATKSAVNCPNKVEAVWYIAHGDAHYDEDYIWTNGSVIYRGGIWIKKKSEIPGFNSTTLPSDVALTSYGYMNTDIKEGTPADTTKYFFLPNQGYLQDYGGPIICQIASSGEYWTKEAINQNSAWCILFAKGVFRLMQGYKTEGMALWSAK